MLVQWTIEMRLFHTLVFILYRYTLKIALETCYKMITSLAESQKGINAVQWCSIEY